MADQNASTYATNHEYELIYILNPEFDEPEILNLNERLAAVVTGQSGEISTTELWGKRSLAYPIKKIFEGHYILHRFHMAPGGVEEIDRLLRFNENVLRYLVIRTDDQ